MHDSHTISATIERVRRMETLFDAVRDALAANPDAAVHDSAVRQQLSILTHYLDDGEWLHDYACDERGELPPDLKRGVLSEDGLYNLVCDFSPCPGHETIYRSDDTMDDFKNLEEIMTASEEIFNGKILHLYRDTVRLPNGNAATRETIRHVGAVAVVALTDDHQVIVERQFRYPLNRVITEIPAGKLDSFTEDRLCAAKRELEEETGYTADNWVSLGDYYPAAAYCDERITIYLATGLHKGARHLDEDEFLNVSLMPLDALVEDIMQGRITDGKTQTALLKVRQLLG